MSARLAALCAVTSALALAAAAAERERPAGETVPGLEVLEQRPGTGEKCLVCGQLVEGADVAQVRYRGRRFFVKADMLGEFCRDPDAYFRQLEARGGLFDEGAVLSGPHLPAGGWFWGGVVVLAGLCSAALCAYLAIGRRRSSVAWFFLGLTASVVAVGVLLALPPGNRPAGPQGVPGGLSKVPTTRAPVVCPTCGASNHPAAAACSRCGAGLSPSVTSETGRVPI